MELRGTEVDPQALEQAQAGGLSALDLALVELRDFLYPPDTRYSAIVANPPYLRHHRLPQATKEKLRTVAARLIGTTLDGRAGLHVYFLLRALELLATGGRLAFIMPADTCEGVFAPALWGWITKHYCLDAVISFVPDASPFPQVDTSPLIFLIRQAPSPDQFSWVRCLKAGTIDLKRWLDSDFTTPPGDDLQIIRCGINEAVARGLSRRPDTPSAKQAETGVTLGDLAKVMRGIATGANEFFFLTRQQADTLKLPDNLLMPAVGRTRDVPGELITQETLLKLEADGRPTLLFAPDGRNLDTFPVAVRGYLLQGQKAGLDQRPLIAQRRPWYRMETRKAPPFLFAYLGRRNARFIRNLTGVMPLTSFLCVYPFDKSATGIEKIWQVLRHPDTVNNLPLVGKSYGAGTIKVEPRALEKLPIPASVIAEAGLSTCPQQLSLLTE